AAQLRAVLEDIPPRAAKTGALGTAAAIRAVAELLAGTEFPLVVDPVMVSKHGAPLMSEEACDVLRRELLPRAYLVTPNLPEAAALSGLAVSGIEEMEHAARRISELGPRAVLVKGGHLDGDAVDLLWDQGRSSLLRERRISTTSTHGTGCTYSAAIAALLAQEDDLPTATALAKQFVTEAIRTAPGLGAGYGPLNHHAGWDQGVPQPGKARL
ncbi:MAG: bifunctional hydroxymethylpyrimidine kinase/phosphomethylpyrimidine kinase, partial [Armatimonadetes bacterium]|nr:bifunctional hydroxymethylpyrimidine kinase/phosphomethylpyrimidine kinase [Armatimonadota bacterium]